MTLKQLYVLGRAELEKANIPDADFDARELLCRAFGLTETDYILRQDHKADEKQLNDYSAFVNRRSYGEPLQYILGEWDFFGNVFSVGEGVLIPRPETEQLAEMCIERIKKGGIKTVYDLCAGTGCIGISIAKACPDTKVYLMEKYDTALSFCRKNIVRNGVKNAEAVQCDIFSGLPEGLPPAQLIVSNPPYVPAEQIPGLQRELHFEPETALDGGNDGLDFYPAIAEKWAACSPELKFAAFECGEEQPGIVAGMFSRFGETKTVNDVFGTQRFVCCNMID